MQIVAGVWYSCLCCWSGVAELSGVWGDREGPRVSGGASAAAQVGRRVWGLGACIWGVLVSGNKRHCQWHAEL